jgi:hypothetical protein
MKGANSGTSMNSGLITKSIIEYKYRKPAGYAIGPLGPTNFE